jgi:transposase
MQAYSMDLREPVVGACDAGELTRGQIAERVAVSTTFVRRLVGRRDQTGSVAPKPPAGGFESAVGEAARAALRDLVRAGPDATLEELRAGLAARCGVSVGVSRVCQVLGELGLPRKKSRTPRASGTART